MSLSSVEIGIVSKSINNAVKGGVVRKAILSKINGEIAFIIRTPSLNHFVNISTRTAHCRLGRREKKPASAPEPGSFVMLLRKYLTGCIVKEIVQINSDRVVEFIFVSKQTQYSLLCELTDKNSNLFLVDSNKIILGSLFANRSSKRSLITGNIYVPPFVNPVFKNNDRLKEPRFIYNSDVDFLYEKECLKREKEALIAKKRLEALQIISTAKKKSTRLLKNLNKDLKKAIDAKELKEKAYVLQANLNIVKKGIVKFKTTDFNNCEITLTLNPALTPVQNMQFMFKQAGRFDKAEKGIIDRVKSVQQQLSTLRNYENIVAISETEKLDGLLDDLKKRYLNTVKTGIHTKGTKQIRCPFKEFAVFGNHIAKVGKSAKDNDELTLHNCTPRDLWLHARGVTGSHVVIPLKRGEQLSSELLIDAAHLAVYFSSAKNYEIAEVTYTFKKYVSKPKGSPAGMVRILKEKTLNLKVNKVILKKLLDTKKL